MKTILLGTLLFLVIIFGGCSSKVATPENAEKVETAWSFGKFLGSIFLSDDTKDKLKPHVKNTEKVYGEVKSIKKDAD